MRKKFNLLIFLLIFISTCLVGQERKELRISATVSPRAVLELNAGAINFSCVDPSIDSLIPAHENEIEVTIRLRIRPEEKVSLMIIAQDDLVDLTTGKKIPVSNINWKSFSDSVRSGILNKTVPQIVGQWNKSGVWRCRINFFLANKENYEPGNFTQVITFSLISP